MADDKQKIEEEMTDLEAKRAGKEEEIQQLVGKEQLRTSLSPSHEKIRDEKDLPTPDPDLLPPEDGGHQTDPDKVVTNEEAFKDKELMDKDAIKRAEEEVKEDESPSKPTTLGDTTTASKKGDK